MATKKEIESYFPEEDEQIRRAERRRAAIEAMKDKKEVARRDNLRPDLGKIGFKKGGYVRAADGIAKRGKTRGKFV